MGRSAGNPAHSRQWSLGAAGAAREGEFVYVGVFVVKEKGRAVAALWRGQEHSLLNSRENAINRSPQRRARPNPSGGLRPPARECVYFSSDRLVLLLEEQPRAPAAPRF